MSRGGGSRLRAGGHGRRAQGHALAEVQCFFSFTRDYFEVFGVLCLRVTLQAVFLEF